MLMKLVLDIDSFNIFQALDYYRRVAQAVAEEVSFSGGSTLQRVRLQVRLEIDN